MTVPGTKETRLGVVMRRGNRTFPPLILIDAARKEVEAGLSVEPTTFDAPSFGSVLT